MYVPKCPNQSNPGPANPEVTGLIFGLVIQVITQVLVTLLFQDGTPTSKTFEHVTSEIGAEEAEEVGVEHLLRYA